jgi:hypothetical protein
MSFKGYLPPVLAGGLDFTGVLFSFILVLLAPGITA